MNGIETQNFSNSVHVDDATSNEANVEEISEREMLFVSVEIFIGGSFGKGNA